MVEQTEKRTKLYEEVAARLRDLIANGELLPGQALPSERKLAVEFEVGRAVVREGVRRLEMAGLIESRHGGGNYVREVTSEHLVAPIANILSGNDHLKEELMNARLFFEPQIAREAARRATVEDLIALTDAVRRQAERLRGGDSTAEEDAEFHSLLARATHNAVVVRVIEVINNLLDEAGVRYFQYGERSLHSLQGNQRILEAVRQHDQAAAQKAMEEHIQDIAKNF